VIEQLTSNLWIIRIGFPVLFAGGHHGV